MKRRRRLRLRRSFEIWVHAPPWSPLSGGIRAMNLLCHRLLANGYKAAITTPANRPPPFPVRYVKPTRLAKARTGDCDPVVVYPEVTNGNPLGARLVVRFLLNKPGLITPGVELTYGPDDYFITSAPELAPEGRMAFDVFLPLVDRNVYHPPPSGSPRDGFVLFTNRARPDSATFPAWLAPWTMVSMREPRTSLELAELYRRSRAMVTWERTTAIHEALMCGCPVICIGDRDFNQETYQPRFRGPWFVWGWREDRLDRAAREVKGYRRIYRRLERNVDRRIRLAFDSIIADALERTRR